MIGKTVYHYKILEKLGEGGMGVVYKAEDTQLKRFVAIKFLPAESTKNPEANARFINEARTASSLDHPNVGVIHQVDRTEDGRMFIVMAYYEGETLKSRIQRGPLPIAEAVEIARRIANGLARAHEAGIIHRDIKPANVELTDRGEVKIVDFGLAKLAGARGITKSGTTLGTVDYMSPEHIEGKSVDHRTDIWSLGVVLYEMITGHKPFHGEHDVATIYSIAHEDFEPIYRLVPEVAAWVGPLIDRALSKEPERRYDSVHELLADLQLICATKQAGPGPLGRLRRQASRVLRRRSFYIAAALVVLTTVGSLSFMDQVLAPRAIRIAVLPFEAEGLGEEDRQAVGGLWATTLDGLHKFSGLRPLSRDLAGRYSGHDYDPSLLKSTYGQEFVLRTVIAEEGGEFQLSAHLTDLEDYGEIWHGASRSEFLNLGGLFNSQLFQAIGLNVSETDILDLTKPPTQSSLAYAYFLRGMNARLEQNLDLALLMFHKALELDSTFALAYVGRSAVYSGYVERGFTTDVMWLDRSEAEALRALKHEESSGIAHARLGMIYLLKGRIQDAYRYGKRAYALEPNAGEPKVLLINVYKWLGLLDKAVALGEELLESQPLNWVARMLHGGSLFYVDRAEEGIRLMEEGLEPYPDSMFLLIWLAWMNISLERLEKAREFVDRALERHPQSMWVRLVEVLMLASEGRGQDARAILTPELRTYAKVDAIRARWMVWIYAELGDIDSAISWLQRQISQGWEGYPDLQKERLLDPLRGDPRFKEIKEDLKGRWERYEKEIE